MPPEPLLRAVPTAVAEAARLYLRHGLAGHAWRLSGVVAEDLVVREGARWLDAELIQGQAAALG